MKSALLSDVNAIADRKLSGEHKARMKVVLLARLKQETRVYHNRIDHELHLFNKSMSLEEYKQLLQRFWGFYTPVERQIDTTKELNLLPFDFEKRKKTPLLARDLRALGVFDLTLQALPTCADLPILECLPQILGCMYVFEGSTLGGQIIARHIAKQLDFTAEHGCSFFSSYGHEVGRMWKSFGDIVTTHSSAEGAEEVIIRSACETFVKLNRWLLEGDRT